MCSQNSGRLNVNLFHDYLSNFLFLDYSASLKREILLFNGNAQPYNKIFRIFCSIHINFTSK